MVIDRVADVGGDVVGGAAVVVVVVGVDVVVGGGAVVGGAVVRGGEVVVGAIVVEVDGGTVVDAGAGADVVEVVIAAAPVVDVDVVTVGAELASAVVSGPSLQAVAAAARTIVQRAVERRITKGSVAAPTAGWEFVPVRKIRDVRHPDRRGERTHHRAAHGESRRGMRGPTDPTEDPQP